MCRVEGAIGDGLNCSNPLKEICPCVSDNSAGILQEAFFAGDHISKSVCHPNQLPTTARYLVNNISCKEVRSLSS